MSAYACDPLVGSEPGAGWSFALNASQFAEVWVITRRNNRPNIEAALSGKSGTSTLNFRYFDLPSWARWWKRGRRGTRVYYYFWQVGAAVVARRLSREVQFDLAHHVTFSSYWLPSSLSFVAVPLVWGPVGGAERIPARIMLHLSLRAKLHELGRVLAGFWSRVDPFVGLTRRRASLILAQTPATVLKLPKRLRARTRLFDSIGLVSDGSSQSRRRSTDSSFRIVSVGRLEYFKGLELGIRAFHRATLAKRNLEYSIIGGGRDFDALERLARTLGVHDKVRFLGDIPRELVRRELGDADLFLHLSLRDPPVFAVAEASLAGLPVVCLDIGGPALQVKDRGGVVVAPQDPSGLIGAIAEVIVNLSSDDIARGALAAQARKLALEKYDWTTKRARLQELYEEVLDN